MRKSVPDQDDLRGHDRVVTATGNLPVALQHVKREVRPKRTTAPRQQDMTAADHHVRP